ncbi:hypothetical protein ES703_35886 [subsurface metagenome]
MRRFFAPKALIIIAGLIFGILAALMTKWGNPTNMGVCAVCFYRDITGALGLHRASVVQYLRPEIMGFMLGALISAFAFGEFRARGGSSPIIRFFLGCFVTIGALVFLGCPIRALLRLAGGDLNGITALAGIVFGAAIGIFFLRRGFNLGPSLKTPTAVGLIMPLFMLGLLFLALVKPGFLFYSEKGPGAQHAALWLSLLFGLLVGFLAQRTRMCFVGAWRDILLVRDTYLLRAPIFFLLGALAVNLTLAYGFGEGQFFNVGFVGQPVSHDNHLWNFLGMTLCGLAATLLGGCPLRQTILSGEGNADAGITVLGLIAGAAFAHNFLLASSPSGTGDFGQVAVIIGLVLCLTIGFIMQERTA